MIIALLLGLPTVLTFRCTPRPVKLGYRSYMAKNDHDKKIEEALMRLSAPAVFSKQHLFGNGNSEVVTANDEEQSLDTDGDDDHDRDSRLRGNR